MTIMMQKTERFYIVYRQNDFLGHNYPITHVSPPLNGYYSGGNGCLQDRNSMLKTAFKRMFHLDLLTVFAKSISRN